MKESKKSNPQRDFLYPIQSLHHQLSELPMRPVFFLLNETPNHSISLPLSTHFTQSPDTRVSCYSIHPPFTSPLSLQTLLGVYCMLVSGVAASIKACCDTTVTATVPVSWVYVLTGAMERAAQQQQGTVGEKQGMRNEVGFKTALTNETLSRLRGAGAELWVPILHPL